MMILRQLQNPLAKSIVVREDVRLLVQCLGRVGQLGTRLRKVSTLSKGLSKLANRTC